MEGEEEKQGFKISDKRRFDSHGNTRDEAEKKEPSSRSSKPAAQPERQNSHSKESSAPRAKDKAAAMAELEINFSSFVVSLATQAMMQLGVMQAPEGMEIPVDPDGAKQTIDILTMLEIKTRGNLEKEEQQLLEEVLHSLRMSFVQITKK